MKRFLRYLLAPLFLDENEKCRHEWYRLQIIDALNRADFKSAAILQLEERREKWPIAL